MRFGTLITAILFLKFSAYGQAPAAEKKPPSEVAGIPVNYDESRVGTYTLPDPLRMADGKPVRDAKTWMEKRRPEVVRLFEEDSNLNMRFGGAERFIRMWEYYLAGFEASFRYYGLVVFQIQLIKNIDAAPLTRDYLYAIQNKRPVNLKIAAAAE